MQVIIAKNEKYKFVINIYIKISRNLCSNFIFLKIRLQLFGFLVTAFFATFWHFTSTTGRGLRMGEKEKVRVRGWERV